MKSSCLDASDIIALVAVFIAIVIPLIQILYERRREWHTACESLFENMDSLYTEIKELAISPKKTNHISYQHCLNHRKNLLDHYANRFIFKQEQINGARRIIISLMDLPENIEYEELINTGFKSKKKYNEICYKFINKIRTDTSKASETLIKE